MIDPLLVRSWQRAWRGLGAEGEGVELRDRLIAAWNEPQRHYHTLRHLLDCLSLFESVLSIPEHAAEVEMALWFHDAIYELRARDNEKRSADWARDALLEARVDAAPAARVHALVLATRHDAEPRNSDERVLVDIDLSILGSPRARFDKYEVEVRQEYAWVPAPVFRHKRRQILAGFLLRPGIYSTPVFAQRLEAHARENLAHAIASLKPWWRLW
jgi:predicted metal-dependent HD superfamily phosphohydrolase